MHLNFTPAQTPRERPPDARDLDVCRQSVTRIVVTRAAAGVRFELLCGRHADRRHQLDQVLQDREILNASAARGMPCDGPTPLELTCRACGQPYASPDCATRALAA
jgi:hypothetical protein